MGRFDFSLHRVVLAAEHSLRSNSLNQLVPISGCQFHIYIGRSRCRYDMQFYDHFVNIRGQRNSDGPEMFDHIHFAENIHL